MSDILDIYESIANMKVGKIKSRNIDKVKLTIRDSDLPLRMLLPATEGEMAFVALGNLQRMGWALRDLCLFAPLTKGSGVQQYSKAMVDYLSLYMEQIKENRNPTTTSNILGVEVQMVPVLWGEKTYWAVDITLTVEEIL
jgi:hypothetical protein